MNFKSKLTILTILSICIVAPAAFAQLSLNIKSVDTSAFPKISVQIVTKDGQLLKRDLDSSKYTVKEDNFLQSPISLYCPIGTTPFGVTILIATGSMMSASDVVLAKGAAEKVILELDGLNDEAALVTYGNSANTVLSMTTNRSSLISSLSGISSTTQNNRFWDGVYGAVLETYNTVNLRAMFVLSNGRDDGSAKTLTDVVALAKTNAIKIFTLGINASGGESNLQNLAQQTGGIAFTNMDVAVQTIVNIMRGTPDYCVLEYNSNNACKDGQQRMLQIKVKANNDSVSTQQQYAIGPDPNSRVNATFKVDTGSITSGNSGRLAILLQNPISNLRFNPATISLSYDKSKLTITSVEVEAGLIANSSAAFAETPTGSDITVTGISALNGKGKLLSLVFTAGSVTQNSLFPVEITSFTFSQGCLIPQLIPGSIKILPKTYSLTGSSKPYVFTWNDSKKDYEPSPAEVVVDVVNNGDLPLTGLTATFPNIDGVKLAFGSVPTVAVVPSTLQPGQKGTATWYVKAQPRSDEKSLQADVIANSTEGAQATIRVFMNIKPATSAVRMTCKADDISVIGGSHTPFPAKITATVLSAGTLTGPSGTVSIELPVNLSLASGSVTQSFPALPSGDSQSLTWEVNYPTTLQTTTSYDIQLTLTAIGAPNDTCLVKLVVPPLTGSNVVASCLTVPTDVAYDSTAKKYQPFEVKAKIKNIGVSASDSIYGELILSAGLMYVPGETTRKVITSTLAGGDSVEVKWSVDVATVKCGAVRTEDFHFKVFVKDVLYFECTELTNVLPRPNLLPEILSKTPGKLDTVNVDATIDFIISTIDADGDPITYKWILNGNEVGGNQSTFSHTFNQSGDYTLLCILRDFCADDSVVVSWGTFHVKKTTSIEATIVPARFELLGNYPNPFNPGTIIEYSIPDGNHPVVMEILDATGSLARTLVNTHQSGGEYAVAFDAGDLPSGVYFVRLRSISQISVKPILLMK